MSSGCPYLNARQFAYTRPYRCRESAVAQFCLFQLIRRRGSKRLALRRSMMSMFARMAWPTAVFMSLKDTELPGQDAEKLVTQVALLEQAPPSFQSHEPKNPW